MKKDYIIYSLKMANELTKRGFKIVNTSINVNFPQFKVFMFEDTPELREAIEQIKN